MKQTLSILPFNRSENRRRNATTCFDHTLRKFRHYVTDHQGNNTAIVTDSGNILQQTRYFPYGEPFREPSHPYTFSDNERLHAGGQNQYDFHARRLIPTLLRFDCPDPLMEKKPWISPYLYCDGNPVMYVDRNGLFSTRAEAEEWAKNNDIELGGDSDYKLRESDGMWIIENKSNSTFLIMMSLHPGQSAELFKGIMVTRDKSSFGQCLMNSWLGRLLIPDVITLGGEISYTPLIGASVSGELNWITRGPDASFTPIRSATGSLGTGVDVGIQLYRSSTYYTGDVEDIKSDLIGEDGTSTSTSAALSVPVGEVSATIGGGFSSGTNGNFYSFKKSVGVGPLPAGASLTVSKTKYFGYK